MSHSKSCRCKLCSACLPDRESCYPDCNSYHWKNRFCKLRKQWSEHSKCGSIKHSPEDCTHSRSPCDKTVGKFGVAWVAEIPDCDNGEPKGWQVEIKDTTPGILKKCKELIEWLNNPPAHLFDTIEGNEPCIIRYSKCNQNPCDESWGETCTIKETPKCVPVTVPKKCRIKCGDDEIIQYDLCCDNPKTCSRDRPKCLKRIKTCQNKCSNRSCDECSDQENSKQTCPIRCSTYNDCSDHECFIRKKCCKYKSCEGHFTCSEHSDQEDCDRPNKCQTKQCNYPRTCQNRCYECPPTNDQCSDHEGSNRKKCCKIRYCVDHLTGDEHSDQDDCNPTNHCQNKCRKSPRTCDDCSERECSHGHSNCHWGTPIPTDGDGVFRKEDCCCHCQKKFFKNAGTTYDIDIVPQKDNNEDIMKPITSDMSELDSKVVCVGIRTSQICKKIKEDKKNKLIEKREQELLNTVIENRSSDDETTKSLYMGYPSEHNSVMNTKLISNSFGSQRRSSKFRRKESG